MGEGARLDVPLGIHDAEDGASEIRYRIWADGKPGPWMVGQVGSEQADEGEDGGRRRDGCR
jgi:hypothetical protein